MPAPVTATMLPPDLGVIAPMARVWLAISGRGRVPRREVPTAGQEAGMNDEPDPPSPGEVSDRLEAEARHGQQLAARLAEVEEHLADVEDQVAATFDTLAASPRGQAHHV